MAKPDGSQAHAEADLRALWAEHMLIIQEEPELADDVLLGRSLQLKFPTAEQEEWSWFLFRAVLSHTDASTSKLTELMPMQLEFPKLFRCWFTVLLA